MSADTLPGDSNGRPLRADDLQLSPPPPPPAAQEPLSDGVPPEALERVRRPPAVTKLRILLRCHEAAARARQVRATEAPGQGGGGVPAGRRARPPGRPRRVRRRLRQPANSTPSAITTPPTGGYTYFIKGENVTQQRYDYFLATGSNYTSAVSAAVLVGLAVVAVFAVFLWLRGRRPEPEPAGVVDEQIAAIVRDHPDAVREWGGPSVLRERCLVAEVLRIEEKNGR